LREKVPDKRDRASIMVPVVSVAVLAIQLCVVVAAATSGDVGCLMVVSVENMKLFATGFIAILGKTMTSD
jgi:hypothetical protein